MQRLAQIVARRGEKARFLAVGRLGGAPRGLRHIELRRQRRALLGDAPLEVDVEAFRSIQRTHEAIGQQIAEQREERERRVGNEPHRPQVDGILGCQPVVHRENCRDRAGDQQQRAFEVPLANGVARNRGERHEHHRDAAKARDGGKSPEAVERIGQVERRQRKRRICRDEALVHAPAYAREADAEQAQHGDEYEVHPRPDDCPMRLRQWRFGQQRQERVQAPENDGRREQRIAGIAPSQPQHEDEDADSDRRDADRSRRERMDEQHAVRALAQRLGVAREHDAESGDVGRLRAKMKADVVDAVPQ